MAWQGNRQRATISATSLACSLITFRPPVPTFVEPGQSYRHRYLHRLTAAILDVTVHSYVPGQTVCIPLGNVGRMSKRNAHWSSPERTIIILSFIPLLMPQFNYFPDNTFYLFRAVERIEFFFPPYRTYCYLVLGLNSWDSIPYNSIIRVLQDFTMMRIIAFHFAYLLRM